MVGTAEAHAVLLEAQGAPWLEPLQARPLVSARSPQLTGLLEFLRAAKPESRVLVFVNTRAVARSLLEVLKAMPDVAHFKPDVVVGHGGFDGMDWHEGQRDGSRELC